MSVSGRLAAAALFALFAACAPRQLARPAAAPVPGMMQVPGGEFTMGRDDGDLNERPAHEVRLDGFYLDRTEASAEEFAAFLNAAGNPDERYFTPDEHATVVLAGASGRDARFRPREGYEGFPANNVSWLGAEAYCRWRGKRLPTEAEWEKAARGTDERLHPWGRWDGGIGKARFGQSWADSGLGVLAPVDSHPEGASAYGVLNMSGNVLEWVGDWYRQNLCDFCNPEGEARQDLRLLLTGSVVSPSGAEPPRADAAPAEGNAAARVRQAPPRVNPPGPATGSFRVLRGGSWQERLAADLTTTRRFWLDPTQRFPSTGVRCAKDPEAKKRGTGLDKAP